MNATTNGMKKLLACLTLCALLLSLGTFFASADDLPKGIPFTPGRYLDGNADRFAPVGEVTVTWNPALTEQINPTDGYVEAWDSRGFTRYTIAPNNLIAWAGDTLDTHFCMDLYAAADADYLYLAFRIEDPKFAYAGDPTIYDGDTIQLGIDFGGLLKKNIERTPDVMSNNQSIIYSVACLEDDRPIRVMRQNSDQDTLLSEEGGNGVKGAARKTDYGWSMEIALSWQMLYDDFCWKAWSEGEMVWMGSEQHLPLTIDLFVCYLNRDETGGDITWAAITTKGLTNDEGAPCVSWSPYDSGIQLVLPWEEGLQINCTGVYNIPYYTTAPVTEPPETLPPETEPPYDPPVEETETQTAVEWYETIPPEVEETLRDVAESLDKEDELNAVLAKYGCTAVVSMGSLTVLVTVAAAAFVIRKKK